MRIWYTFILLLVSSRLFAQQLSGTVIDKATKEPVDYATVSTANISTYTTGNGKFSLSTIHLGDTLRVNCMGYKPYKLAVSAIKNDTLTIYLQQVSILLRDVAVRAKHDRTLDSIRTRKEFSSIFGYQNLTYKDMFITKDPYVYVPYNYIDAPNSTASIVSVNLLSVIGLLDKNKNSSSKLQKTLLQDEQDNYIDREFSKQKIMALTNLKGDSLVDFMATYRPTIKQAQKMNDYEMSIYIKDSFAEFKQSYSKEEQSPFR